MGNQLYKVLKFSSVYDHVPFSESSIRSVPSCQISTFNSLNADTSLIHQVGYVSQIMMSKSKVECVFSTRQHHPAPNDINQNNPILFTLIIVALTVPVKCPTGTYSRPAFSVCYACQAGYVCQEGSSSSTPADGKCYIYMLSYENLRLMSDSPEKCENYLSMFQALFISTLSSALKHPRQYMYVVQMVNCEYQDLVSYPTIFLLGVRVCSKMIIFRTKPQDFFRCGILNASSLILLKQLFSLNSYAVVVYNHSFPFVGLCKPGGWCDGRTFHPCPFGTYNPSNGSKSASKCTACPASYYCMDTGLDSYSSYSCPAGHYCPIGTKFDTQFPCPAGTNSSLTNQSTIEACKPCPETLYCPSGSISGQICPAGYYCPEGTGAPRRYACPVGTYSSTLGLKNGTECTECPVGHYCPDGSQNQPTVASIPCPPGTYNPKTRIGYLLNCEPCPSGYACPRSGQVMYNDTCREGFYCPNGTVSPSQYPCPPGTYTNRTDLNRAEECTPCPRGKSCNWATAVSFNKWQDCQQGHYCPLGLYTQF